MAKITIYCRGMAGYGQSIHVYEDVHSVSQSAGYGNQKSFLSVTKRENPREKSYTNGSLWWKKTVTYTEYDYNTIAMIRCDLVERVDIERE